MLTNLCNIGHEGHIDSFYKCAVIDARYAPRHNNFTPLATLEARFNNLNPAVDVLAVDFLPDQASVSHDQRNSDDGKEYRTRANFFVSPQNLATQAAIESFANREVIFMVHKRTSVHIYGSKDFPLLFSYDEVNGAAPGSPKGYTVVLTGTSVHRACYIDNATLAFTSNKLALKLAAKL